MSANMQVAHHPGSSPTARRSSCADALAGPASHSAAAATAAIDTATLDAAGAKVLVTIWGGGGGRGRAGL
jgi:hypothetical protein